MPRQSNFELLRIIAMMLILAVHMNYYALGAPTADELSANPIGTSTRCLLESISLICVNLFIFISGWFGIKLRREKLLSFLFQIAWFYFGIWIVMLILGKATVDLRSIKLLLLLTPHNWFIPAYLLLFFLAPVLNSFTRTADQRTFSFTLIGFFTIQTWSGWAAFTANFGWGGYSTLSFIGIYMLSQYIRRFELYKWFTIGRSIAISIGCILLNTIFGIITIRTGSYTAIYMAYINPLTLIATVSFAMIFINIRFVSPTVNFIAASAFAAFLLHSNFNIVGYFKELATTVYTDFSGPAVIAIDFLACLAWFGAAVILDQPRKWLWALLHRNLFKQPDPTAA